MTAPEAVEPQETLPDEKEVLRATCCSLETLLYLIQPREDRYNALPDLAKVIDGKSGLERSARKEVKSLLDECEEHFRQGQALAYHVESLLLRTRSALRTLEATEMAQKAVELKIQSEILKDNGS